MKDMIREIAADNTSGAVEITLKAAQALKHSMDSTSFGMITELVDHILKTSREIYLVKPAMASLVNLGAYVLAGAQDGASLDEGLVNAHNQIEQFIELMNKNVSLAAKHGASLMEGGSSIMTISYSATVVKAFIEANSGGAALRIFCLESRPLMEGVTMARELAAAGIETMLLTDASALMFMEEVSMVVVGGDSLSPEGLVNKIGTGGLALAAEKLGIPFYALCTSEKILPSGLGYQPMMDRNDPEQILRQPPKNVEVINCFFDVTPLDRLTGVITEKGLIQADLLMDHLTSLPNRHATFQILQR